ncbi:MAG: hypothetical protein LBQ51_05270 [Desulfovibrio sp.]|jgi:hypothetical protein|nr:hypothetical protein [Desulfovibrio sp.]
MKVAVRPKRKTVILFLQVVLLCALQAVPAGAALPLFSAGRLDLTTLCPMRSTMPGHASSARGTPEPAPREHAVSALAPAFHEHAGSGHEGHDTPPAQEENCLDDLCSTLLCSAGSPPALLSCNETHPAPAQSAQHAPRSDAPFISLRSDSLFHPPRI